MCVVAVCVWVSCMKNYQPPPERPISAVFYLPLRQVHDADEPEYLVRILLITVLWNLRLLERKCEVTGVTFPPSDSNFYHRKMVVGGWGGLMMAYVRGLTLMVCVGGGGSLTLMMVCVLL